MLRSVRCRSSITAPWPNGRGIGLRDFGLDHRVHDRVGDLTVAERQLVEISRAMSDRARILILDEPTASLGTAETRELFRHVATMRDRGAAIILIAHNIDEVLELSDRISVLRNGRLVTTQARSEIDYDMIVRRHRRARIAARLSEGGCRARRQRAACRRLPAFG